MIPASHPYWHVREVLERHANVVSVPLSYYTYEPRTIKDERQTWEVDFDTFLDARRMAQFIDETPTGRELAIHSNIRVNGNDRLHLVMVDMSTAARAQLHKLRVFLGDNSFQQIAWYSSGRSFHGYGTTLMPQSKWYEFMGLLLLANQPHQTPTVDPRWIGHRLLAGYASLRWTRNTSRYIVVPTRVDPVA